MGRRPPRPVYAIIHRHHRTDQRRGPGDSHPPGRDMPPPWPESACLAHRTHLRASRHGHTATGPGGDAGGTRTDPGSFPHAGRARPPKPWTVLKVRTRGGTRYAAEVVIADARHPLGEFATPEEAEAAVKAFVVNAMVAAAEDVWRTAARSSKSTPCSSEGRIGPTRRRRCAGSAGRAARRFPLTAGRGGRTIGPERPATDTRRRTWPATRSPASRKTPRTIMPAEQLRAGVLAVAGAGALSVAAVVAGTVWYWHDRTPPAANLPVAAAVVEPQGPKPARPAAVPRPGRRRCSRRRPSPPLSRRGR